MKGKRSLLVALVIVLTISITTLCICAEDKVELRLQLEKGQSYKMKMVQDMKIRQTIQGKEQEMPQKMEMGYIYTVEEVQADGTAIVKVTYDSLLFKQEGPMGKIEYDFSNPSAAVGPGVSVFDALVGQSFIVTITPDGHIKEIQGADAILECMQEKLNELPEGPMRAGVETNLRMQYGEEALKENMENSFNMYPDKPVGVGDTWQKRSIVSKGFPMIANTIYTLNKRENGIATISIFSMIQPNRKAGPMEMGLAKLNYNISGSVMGTIEMQESTGWIIRSNQDLKLSGSATVEHPEMKKPMSIPISITGTVIQEPY